MKDLKEFITEDVDAYKKIDRDVHSLICKLLGKFVTGKIDMEEAKNKELVDKAKVFLFNLG